MALVDLEILDDVFILERKGIDTNDDFRFNAMLLQNLPFYKQNNYGMRQQAYP